MRIGVSAIILMSCLIACSGNIEEPSSVEKNLTSTQLKVTATPKSADGTSEPPVIPTITTEDINSNSSEAEAPQKPFTDSRPVVTLTPSPAKSEAVAASPSQSPLETKSEDAITPTPTSIATPTPFPLNIPFKLDFTATTHFSSFSKDEEKSFSQSLTTVFDQAFHKAGINAAVFNGSSLWTGALGEAAPGKIMRATTPMIIRSTSKTFLGALMISQIDQGLYKLTDTVEFLLSDHPDYHLIDIPNVNPNVTVEQLLTMTSGISDWSKQTSFEKRIEIMMDDNWRPAGNLTKIPSKFVPPGNYNYSYANSILLGLIASHKGGKDLNAIYQETFFEPLGIIGGLLPEINTPTDTAISYDDLSLYQYQGQGGVGFGPLNSGIMAQFYGKDPKISWAGAGIVSTPENIARWGYELFSPSGSAVSEKVRARLFEGMTVPTDPGMTDMGMHTYGYYMGSGRVSLPGGAELKIYTHPGGGGGRTSWLYYSPELDASISLLANSQMLHGPGRCGYSGFNFMTNGECIAGGIFSKLSGP